MRTANEPKTFEQLVSSKNAEDVFEAFLQIARQGPEALELANREGIVPALTQVFEARLSDGEFSGNEFVRMMQSAFDINTDVGNGELDAKKYVTASMSCHLPLQQRRIT